MNAYFRRSRLVVTFTLLATLFVSSFTAIVEATPSGERLRTLASRRDFYVGAAVRTGSFSDNEQPYMNVVKDEFNLIVPENMMKFEKIHPTQGVYDWSVSDPFVDFAEANGMKIRGHTLVWHEQLPGWVKNGSWTKEEAKDILKDHIQTVVGRYKGRIWAWDVVNEAISGDDYRTNSFWYKTIGPEYIELAFQWAHEADPDAILYYNDYGAESTGTKSNRIYTMVKELKEAGVPIHGVGWQMHVSEGWRLGNGHRKNAERIKELGLELSITEMDVRLKLPSDQAQLESQALSYWQALTFCLQETHCKAFVTWGFTDKYSWIKSDALIFDANYEAKPAYYAMQSALLVDPDKKYRLTSVNSNRDIDVCGRSTEDNACVQQWSYANQTNQQFRFEVMSDGYHRIRAIHSDKCLQVEDASTENEARVRQWTCGDGDNQRWKVRSVGANVVLEAKHSQKVIEVAGASKNNGARLYQNTRTDAKHQLWKLTSIQ